MEILARGVGRRKEAIAQVQIIKGTGQFIINNLPAQQYLHNNTCSLISVKSPFIAVGGLGEGGQSSLDNLIATNLGEAKPNNTEIQTQNPQVGKGGPFGVSYFETMDTIVKVKGGGLVGQAEAIKLGLARALCQLKTFESKNSNQTKDIIELHSEEIRKNLKDKGLLTQDSRVKERRKYGLKKARKASQYHKR